jgi:hypothetical protein
MYSFTLEIDDAFELDRAGEEKRYNAGGFHEDENRMLLWHGSRLTNFVGILSQGWLLHYAVATLLVHFMTFNGMYVM